MNYEAFDAASWRALNARGCTDASVALLLAYRQENQRRLTREQLLEMNFHIGQAYAFAQRDGESIPYFEQALGPDAPEEWSAYVQATLAFLQHRGADLSTQYARYRAAPGADAMRTAIIEGLLACPRRPYAEAAHCAMHMSG